MTLHTLGGEQTSKKLGHLFSEVESIEKATGTSGNVLYFLILKINELWDRCVKVRERVVKAYLRIPFKEALKLAYSEAQVLDNFQNGYLGLVRATSTYDADIGVSFGSYARTWVRQSIWFGLKRDSGVSQHFWNLHSRIERARDLLVADGEEATTNAISAKTGISKKRIARTARIRQASNLCSLDHATSFDERNLYAKIEDSEATEVMQQEHIVEEVTSLLEDLDRLPLRVVALKHGLFDRLPGKSRLPESEVVRSLARNILAEAKR
jgi:DNA-directed RNA polymerase specialized sigma subunit